MPESLVPVPVLHSPFESIVGAPPETRAQPAVLLKAITQYGPESAVGMKHGATSSLPASASRTLPQMSLIPDGGLQFLSTASL